MHHRFVCEFANRHRNVKNIDKPFNASILESSWRRIFGTKREEITRGLRKLLN
jgi:hypothetical protein